MAGCDTRHRLFLDLETFSSADITKTGSFRYMEEPDFEVLLIAYAWDDGPVTVIDVARRILDGVGYSEVRRALIDPDVVKVAHNAAFERQAIWRFTGNYQYPSAWEDTMILAAMNGLPMSLDAAGAALGLKDQKIKEGTSLISYFCKPCKPTMPMAEEPETFRGTRRTSGAGLKNTASAMWRSRKRFTTGSRGPRPFLGA